MACLIEFGPRVWRSAQCADPDVEGGKLSDYTLAMQGHGFFGIVAVHMVRLTGILAALAVQKWLFGRKVCMPESLTL